MAGTFRTIDDSSASQGTIATSINNEDEIIGYYSNSSGQHGFVDNNGTFTTLDDPLASGLSTVASGINDAGDIVGSYYDGTREHGFVYSNGIYTTIDEPSASQGTIVKSINNEGEIVGYYSNPSGQHGFVDNNGTFTTLDDPLATGLSTVASGINDAGDIVGSYYDGTREHGFVYSNGIYTTINDPSASQGTMVTSINNEGEIVGYYSNSSGQHGFVDNSGTFTTLDDPLASGLSTVASGINDAGDIVGSYYDGTREHGFIALPPIYTIKFDFTQVINEEGELQKGILTCEIFETGNSEPIWTKSAKASQDDVFPVHVGAVTGTSWTVSGSLGLVLPINSLAGNPSTQKNVEFHVGGSGSYDGITQWSHQSESCVTASNFFPDFESEINSLMNPSGSSAGSINLTDVANYLNGTPGTDGSTVSWSFDVTGDNVTQDTLGIKVINQSDARQGSFYLTLDDRPLEKDVKVLYTVLEYNTKSAIVSKTTREVTIGAEAIQSSSITIASLNAQGSGYGTLDPDISIPKFDRKYYTTAVFDSALSEKTGDTYGVFVDAYEALYTGSTAHAGWYFDSKRAPADTNLIGENLMFAGDMQPSASVT